MWHPLYSLGLPQNFLIQGKCDSSFPTYDGSCNHPNNFSRAMSSYKRLVAAEYCDNQHQPRCSTRGRDLPSEVSFEFSVKWPFTFVDTRIWSQILDGLVGYGPKAGWFKIWTSNAQKWAVIFEEHSYKNMVESGRSFKIEQPSANFVHPFWKSQNLGIKSFLANNFNNNETRRWSSKSKSKCFLPFHCLGPILNPRYYSNTRCR